MNVFDTIPQNSREEIFTELLKTDNVRIERIVSFGQSSPSGFWYDQEESEWILLLEGSASLTFEQGETIDLKPGESLNIPAKQRHRVEKTDRKKRTIWLAVFYPPAGNDELAQKHV